MLSATIKYSVLSELLNRILAIREDTKVSITESGLSISAVCPANVSIFSTDLSSASFETYSCEPIEIGLDVAKLKDFLAIAKKDDIISLELPKNASKLTVEFAGLSYDVALLAADTMRSLKIPELTLDARALLPRAKLLKIIKAAEKIEDVITFSIDNTSQTVSTTSKKETDALEGTITKDDLTEDVEGKATSIYSLDYLSGIIKATVATEVEIKLNTDMPMTITAPIDEYSVSTFMLAPRIES
jgi:proliferating cell nuclear antigen